MGEALALLSPASLAKIDAIRDTARALANVHEVLPIDGDEGRNKAAQLLRVIETMTREAEALRKADKAPHLKACQDVDESFKVATEHLQRVAGGIRARLSEWSLARERKEQEQRRLAAEAAAKSDAEAANLALADPVFAPVEQPKGVAEVWSWEVETVTIGKVPAEYLALDLTKVKAYIRDCDRVGKQPEIAGLTFKRTVGQRVRSL